MRGAHVGCAVLGFFTITNKEQGQGPQDAGPHKTLAWDIISQSGEINLTNIDEGYHQEIKNVTMATVTLKSRSQ